MTDILKSFLRTGAGRLVAAGIAILVSVAFIATVLSLSDAFNRTMRTTAQGSYAGSDVIISSSESMMSESSGDDAADSGEPVEFDAKVAKKLATDAQQIPQISQTQADRSIAALTKMDGVEQYITAATTPIGRHYEFVSGKAPQGPGQVMLYQDTAKSLGLSQGQQVNLDTTGFASETDDSGKTAKDTGKKSTVTVTGILRGSDGGDPTVYTDDAGLDALGGDSYYESLRIVLKTPGDPPAQSQVAHDFADLLAKQRGGKVVDKDLEGLQAAGFTVQTNEQVVDQYLKTLSGGTNILTSIVLAFGAVALFVAALVIANTFQVLVASRTRTLALLRAIGATRGQIRAATLAEAFVLGLVGSVLGVLLGWGLAVGFSYLARSWMGEFEIATLPVSAAIAGPVLGVVVTVLACLTPARKATKVTPIQALAPVDIPAPNAGFPWIRAILGGIVSLVGLVATVFGGIAHQILLALPGAIVLFCGILLLTRVIVPPFVQVLGHLFSAITRSPAIGLVARNIKMAPRRTASTTTALLIGVTLVSTMMIGAQTMKTTSQAALAESNAVDMSIAQPSEHEQSVIQGSDIVSAHAHLDGAKVTVPGTADPTAADADENPAGDDSAESAGQSKDLALTALAPDSQALKAARGKDLTPQAGTVYINDDQARELKSDSDSYTTGDPVGTFTFKGERGTVKLKAVAGHGIPRAEAVMDTSDLSQLQPTASEGAMWTEISDQATSSDVQKLTSALNADDRVDQEGAIMRVTMSSIINVVLAIVLVLLAASLVVAVVGVANTLSLSVMERRRETALLRAMGMTRSQVSWMVAVEALLMALVAIILGLVLGLLFSWAGISSLIQTNRIAITVGIPWGQIGAVIVAAILASLLASLIPARAVSRTKPAEGLSA